MKLEQYPDHPYTGQVVTPTPEYVDILKSHVAAVERHEMSARELARHAVLAGLLLIGTTESKPVHEPVDYKEHAFTDIREKGVRKYHTLRENPNQDISGQKLLLAGKQADIALMCALFGDLNNREERIRRCLPFTGYEDNNFGWGSDIYAALSESGRRDYYAEEESPVTAFARVELIKAIDEDRLSGTIDCIYDDVDFAQTHLDIAQYIGPVVSKTLFSIPARGYDLEYILPSGYNDLSNLAK